MIYIDETKLRKGTIIAIGEDYEIDGIKYNMLSKEGIDAYVDEILDILYEKTEDEIEELLEYIKQDWLEEQN